MKKSIWAFLRGILGGAKKTPAVELQKLLELLYPAKKAVLLTAKGDEFDVIFKRELNHKKDYLEVLLGFTIGNEDLTLKLTQKDSDIVSFSGQLEDAFGTVGNSLVQETSHCMEAKSIRFFLIKGNMEAWLKTVEV